MNEFRQLDDLVRSAAREPLPPVDWQRVERELFERIDREKLRPGSPRAAWGPVLAIAAAAAVIAAVGAMTGSGERTRSDASAAAGSVFIPSNHGQPLAAIEASELHERDRIEAGPEPLTVRHPGLAAWNLAPRSRVVIERLGESVRLSLESGKVRVEVAPGSSHDAFVVRVDDTTVSVHGTVFSVERLADRAAVHVEQGAVSIGARSRRGSVSSWLMVAPSAGTFSLDGARVAAFAESSAVPAAGPPVDWAPPAPKVFVPPAVAPTTHEATDASPQPPAEASTERQPPRATFSSVAEVEAPPASDALPETLTSARARSTLDRLAAAISDCHRRLRPSRPGDPVQVTVHTNLSITVAPEGNVSLGRFDPPLAPDVQACAANALLSARFPQAQRASQLQLALRF